MLQDCTTLLYYSFYFHHAQGVLAVCERVWECSILHEVMHSSACVQLFGSKDGKSRWPCVLIERQRCTVIIMKALQEKLKSGRESYETWRKIFILKESISFLADELEEEISIREEASTASVDVH